MRGTYASLRTFSCEFCTPRSCLPSLTAYTEGGNGHEACVGCGVEERVTLCYVRELLPVLVFTVYRVEYGVYHCVRWGGD